MKQLKGQYGAFIGPGSLSINPNHHLCFGPQTLLKISPCIYMRLLWCQESEEA